jgi:hypothetical protein
MDVRIAEINEQLRNELLILWKKGGLTRVATTIKRSLSFLKKEKLVPSLEINVSYGPAMGSESARSMHPLCYITPSFTFSGKKSKKLSDILRDKDISDDEKERKILGLHSEEFAQLYKIEFSPIHLEGKAKTCSACNGAGYVFPEE